jgi:hypothetical protein
MDDGGGEMDDGKGIRVSGYQVAGHQENRVSGN